ncbi:hypothetical protein BC835DRAFT_1411799 [Cytidiella melzeri]|nr:hypothetical protein BC835DRAFT_1411799 [Cytidiella melzeri]
MSKRPLSPSLQPPPKRLHNTHSTSTIHPKASFDQLWDEIVLVIFSYLSYKDLCGVQATSQNWSRLTLDNQLWKKLYLDEYGRARLRGGRGFVRRQDGREMKPLPGRAHVEADESIRDWKWMFRISSNWRTGRCAVEQWEPHESTVVPSSAEPSEESNICSRSHTCVLLAGSLVITSSTNQGHPSLLLISPDRSTYNLSCRTRSSDNDTVINCIVLDQSPPTSSRKVRLAAFLSTTEFIVFSIDHHTPAQSTRQLSHLPLFPVLRLTDVFRAVFHDNLVIALTHSFDLSFYDLSSGSIVHTQTLYSYASYPPSSMVLTPVTPETYRLVLTYSVPVFPAHWSVGATELMISSKLSSQSVVSSRSIRAFDIPMGWLDVQNFRIMREQWSRKLARVADTQTDGKWIVVAPAEASPASHPEREGSTSTTMAHTLSSIHSPSSLQLYRLSFPASSSSSPKLTFVRMLHGQVGPCSALSLADGRCVSLGVNGSIWVWDLEGGTGTEVDQGSSSADLELSSGAVIATKGAVMFDERTIVSAGLNGVEVRRFDV